MLLEYDTFHALVVKWISQRSSEPLVQVRFLPSALVTTKRHRLFTSKTHQNIILIEL